MKKILFVLLLLILTACASPAGPSALPTGTEPTRENAPSAASSTVRPTVLPPTLPPLTLPSDNVDDESQPIAGIPAIVFHKEGGLAGVDLLWTIYDSGQIVTPTGEEYWVESGVIDELLELFSQTGFFELSQSKSSDICCDFFTYTLAVNNGEQINVITYTDGDPNAPPGLADLVSAVLQVTDQQTEE